MQPSDEFRPNPKLKPNHVQCMYKVLVLFLSQQEIISRRKFICTAVAVVFSAAHTVQFFCSSSLEVLPIPPSGCGLVRSIGYG